MNDERNHAAVAEDYLEGLLASHADLGPNIDAMTDEHADQRVRVEIAKIDGDRQGAGLWSINKVLKEHGVPPSVRLHLVSATVNLSLLAARNRAAIKDGD